MRITTLLLLISLTVLASCTWGDKKETSPGPYPSVPMGVSTEIGLSKKAPKGSSYKATGTEPFWSVEVKPGSAVLSQPGNSGAVTTSFVITEDDKSAIVVIKGVKGDFFLNMIKGPCNDGMSDKNYAYKATVLVGAETLSGCADKQ